MSLLNERTKTVIIKRCTTTQTPGMGTSSVYTTAARGALPTSLDARIFQPGGEARQEYAQNGVQLMETLLFETQPHVDTRDIIVIGTRVMHVLAERNPAEADDFWVVDVVEPPRGQPK